jgi:hypothetical protein
MGTGTSIVASALLGIPAIGVDLDPFSALLSRAHIATKADLRFITKLLGGSAGSECSFPGKTDELFRPSDLRFSARVIENVRRSVVTKSDGRSVLASLLDDPLGTFDSEVVAVAALCIAAASAAKVVRGSNPVWLRRALPGELGRSPRLETLTRSASERMVSDLSSLPIELSNRDIRIFNEDFRHTSLPPGSANLLLTSPPYLNRLDYVVSHLPSLMILGGLVPVSIDDLRSAMIGTTKIVDKGVAIESWGTTCLNFLESVRRHPSKASAGYYYWIYYQYFNDIYISLERLKRVVEPGGRGAFVIRTSFYKNVPVPIPQVIAEMAANQGIGARVARSEIIKTPLGGMSPRQSRYVPRKILEECVLALEF